MPSSDGGTIFLTETNIRNEIPYFVVLVKTVSASPKGQLSIPVDMLRAMGIKGRTEFVAVQDGDRIVLRPSAKIAQEEVDDLEGWLALAEPVFKELWDNPEDKVWDDL